MIALSFKTLMGPVAVLAVLSLAGAALSGEAMTPPNPGQPGARRAPGDGALPVDAKVLDALKSTKPTPTPKLPKAAAPGDRSGTSHYRPENFGTVTKTLGGDGSISTAPPSDEVERAIKQQNAVPAPKQGENAGPMDAIKPAAALGPGQLGERSVFGTDERVQIGTTQQYPYRAIGLLQMKFSGLEGFYGCSGALIGQSTVLTAAHCLYHVEREAFPEEVYFYPGISGSDAPFGYYAATSVEVLSSYVNSPGRIYDWQHMLHDIGVVHLGGNVGGQLGTLGYASSEGLAPFMGQITGYPGDKPFGTMWWSSCFIDTVRGQPSIFETPCDTYKGNSGSSIYNQINGGPMVYGLYVADLPDYSAGLHLTLPYYAWVAERSR